MTDLLQKLRCAVFGHDFTVWQVFSSYSRRVVCDRCGGDWGMNDDAMAMIPWSRDLEHIHEIQGRVIRRRPQETEGSP